MPTYTSTSPSYTKELAKDILNQLGNRHVIALTGELGAGKTAFAQGIAQSLGIEYLPSPTFTLMDIHPITSTLYPIPYTLLVHIDCYRLDDPQQLIDIGVREYLDDETSLVVIEWADKVKTLLPSRTFWITFRHGENEHERTISIDM